MTYTIADVREQAASVPASWVMKGWDAITGQIIAQEPTETPAKAHPPIVEKAIRSACEQWGVTKAEILSHARPQWLLVPRFAVYLALRKNGLSLASVGRAIAGRDHGSILNGVKAIQNWMISDRRVNSEVTTYLRGMGLAV